MEALLTERDVARILNISVATVRRRRLFRQPPAWIKLGSSVRYLPEVVAKLIEDGRRPLSANELLGAAKSSPKRRSRL